MSITVVRGVNVFYYLCFLIYALIFLIIIIPRRKKQPFKNAFKIFIATTIVLFMMEAFGTFSGIRVFYIFGSVNVGFQLLFQSIMSIGEGGTATGIIYLMVEAIYIKNYKWFFLLLVTLAGLMLVFALFTFSYQQLTI